MKAAIVRKVINKSITNNTLSDTNKMHQSRILKNILKKHFIKAIKKYQILQILMTNKNKY